MLQFDTIDNPWLRVTKPGGKNWTRLGYGTRPLAGWRGWAGDICLGWPDRSSKEMPRTNRLSGETAILSDIVSTPDYVDTHHRNGVNFTRLGGSTHWFDCGGLNVRWHALQGDWYAGGPYAPGFYNDTMSPPTGVWFDMDIAPKR